MARITIPILVFNGDPLISTTMAFFVLWLIVTLVQWGQAAKIVSSPVNATRRGIFGTLLGATICLSVSYGFHIGRIVIENTDSNVTEEVWVAFLAVDLLFRVGGLVLAYLPIFLVIYHRVAMYVGPPSQLWFAKKIVDGISIGLWALLYIVEIAWLVAGYVSYYIENTITTSQFSLRSSTTRSLDAATGSFFIFVHIAAIAGIIMLNSASNSQNKQDPIVRTLMRAMLPILAFRFIWNIISLVIYDLPGVIRTVAQSKIINLVDGIIEPLSLAIMIGVLLRLGFQNAFWDVPAGVTPQPGSTPQQPYGTYGGQQMVGGQQGMTMLIGHNGLPVLGVNGQPIFVPAGPAPGQGPDGASMEAWKHQSMYSPTPVSTTTNYQQQNVLPYGQFAPQQQFITPQQQQFITPQQQQFIASQQQQFISPQQQQQFGHLPQPPAGYFYQPPGVNAQAPRPSSQAFQQQQPLPPVPVIGQDSPRGSLDPFGQPNVHGSPRIHSASSPSVNGPPAAAPS